MLQDRFMEQNRRSEIGNNISILSIAHNWATLSPEPVPELSAMYKQIMDTSCLGCTCIRNPFKKCVKVANITTCR